MIKYEHLTSNASIDDAYYRTDYKTQVRKPACDCVSGNCVEFFTKLEIREARSYLWHDRDEAAVVMFLSKIITSGKDKVPQPPGRSTKKYFFSCLDHGEPKTVCRVAYQKIYGISNNKYQHAERFNEEGHIFF